MLCRQQVAELEKKRQDFEDKKSELVVIGCGPFEHLEEFRRVTGYGGRLLTDPSREAFRLLGLFSGLTGLLGTKSISRAISALKGGVRPGSIQGNALQLGGAVIITPEDSVSYIYRSSEAGDDPPIEEMLEALG